VVKLRNERPQFFEEYHAELFQIAFAFGGLLVVRVGPADMFDVAIQANGPRLGGQLPLLGTKENANMSRVNLRHARGDAICFQRLVDRAKDDGVAGHVDKDSPARQVGDNLVLLCPGGPSANSIAPRTSNSRIAIPRPQTRPRCL